jgi:N-methylhydantoinase A
VNENMSAATRIHVAERGADARRMFLMAFGGAGPMHADAIARALGMRGYIVPASAGVTSALGFLTAPSSFELARGFVGALTQARLADVESVYAALEEEGRALLRGAGVAEDEMRFVRQADLRHAGQGHEIVVELPDAPLADVSLEDELKPRFYDAYEIVYGHAHRHLELEIMTCRVTASGPEPTVAVTAELEGHADAAAALVGTRPTYHHALGGFVETAIYARELLHSGAVVEGPAVIEDRDSTAVVGPGATAVVDNLLNLRTSFT